MRFVFLLIFLLSFSACLIPKHGDRPTDTSEGVVGYIIRPDLLVISQTEDGKLHFAGEEQALQWINGQPLALNFWAVTPEEVLTVRYTLGANHEVKGEQLGSVLLPADQKFEGYVPEPTDPTKVVLAFVSAEVNETVVIRKKKIEEDKETSAFKELTKDDGPSISVTTPDASKLPQPTSNVQLGVHRDRRFYVDMNGNGFWDNGDTSFSFGLSTDTPIIGDWNGDGKDEIGVHRGNRFLLDMDGDGTWNAGDVSFLFGIEGDRPIVGDWNGDGKDYVGVHRENKFFLDKNGSRAWDDGDVMYRYGADDDTAVIGDWDGDGRDQIGVHRGRTFYLDDGDGVFNATGDSVFAFGIVNDTPLSGDWNGDGKDEVGVHRNRYFFLDHNANQVWDGAGPDKDIWNAFGIPGDTPFVTLQILP